MSRQDFENALDKLLLGGKREALMDERERRIVAYHEGGHALVAAVLPDVDPVYKVTIVPRGRSLGVTQFRPEDDRRNLPRTYLIERLAVALGVAVQRNSHWEILPPVRRTTSKRPHS